MASGLGVNPQEPTANDGTGLLNRLILFFFRSPVTAQQLRQVLGKCRARQHHVAAHFVGLLLQISLDMGKESDNRGSLLQLAFQFGDLGQRLGVGIVQVKDDQRRLFFAILLHLFHEILVGFDELDLDVELAGGLLNFRHEE